MTSLAGTLIFLPPTLRWKSYLTEGRKILTEDKECTFLKNLDD